MKYDASREQKKMETESQMGHCRSIEYNKQSKKLGLPSLTSARFFGGNESTSYQLRVILLMQ
jgi:hypothetical protein